MKKRKPRSMALTMSDAVADAVEALEESERLDIDESDFDPIEQLQVKRSEWEFLKQVLLPILFASRPPPRMVSETAPGSADRVEVMRARKEANEDLWHSGDATCESTGKKLKTRMRLNGGRRGGNTTAKTTKRGKPVKEVERTPDDELNMQVLGWEDAEPGSTQ